MQRRRRMRAFRTVTVPAVAAVLIAVAAVTSGSIIPGGGPLPLGDAPFTDCYLYVRTNGTLTPNNQKYFVCEDGDPTCDQDRQCDGACTFSAALCEGLAGSSAAQAMVVGCEPPPGLDRLHLSKGCPLDAPEDLGGSACGAFVTFQVELKGSRQQRVNRSAVHGACPRHGGWEEARRLRRLRLHLHAGMPGKSVGGIHRGHGRRRVALTGGRAWPSPPGQVGRPCAVVAPPRPGRRDRTARAGTTGAGRTPR